MRDWANVSVHTFSVVHGYYAINIYGQVHVCGEKLLCQCKAGNVVCCFHCAMWSPTISVIHDVSIVEHVTYCRKFLTY